MACRWVRVMFSVPNVSSLFRAKTNSYEHQRKLRQVSLRSCKLHHQIFAACRRNIKLCWVLFWPLFRLLVAIRLSLKRSWKWRFRCLSQRKCCPVTVLSKCPLFKWDFCSVLVYGFCCRLCLSHLSDFGSYLGVTLCRQLNLYTYFHTSVLRKPFRMVVT